MSKSDTPKSRASATTLIPLSEIVEKRYLSYALSTIMNRALPDARDGLKPVQRRILYAMRGLRLRPGGHFRKSAKICGDVMGNFHPHGDAAIYDAMVRLAQPFNSRYPLVAGQGNFGNIDGDDAAASRYTEARLTEFAEAIMQNLDEDAVDFVENYDARMTEPTVLPTEVPNLLANGASGIAVGMATSIPPHNVRELIKACLQLLKNPQATTQDLMKSIPGPDFPTGGEIVESKENLHEIYISGRGSLRVRAIYEVEKLPRGRWQIVIREIPYQVSKSRLIERIAKLIIDNKLPQISNIRDESAEDIRIIIEPHTANIVTPEQLMVRLFQSSDLETRFSVNMNALIDGKVPKLMGLKELLSLFIEHRFKVIMRITRFRLKQVEARLEIVDGFLIAFDNLDEIISIIRYKDKPESVLQTRFGLSERQVEAILGMQLRRLRKLDRQVIRDEHKTLLQSQKNYAA